MIDITPELKKDLEAMSKDEFKAAYRQLCKKDLWFLSKYVLFDYDVEGVIPLDRDYHGAMCDWLQIDRKRSLLLAPRGTFKTTIATVNYCIWEIINNPNITILIASGTLDNARKFLSFIDQHFRHNSFFRYLFDDLIPETFNDNWTQSQILVNRTIRCGEKTIEVVGADSELTSRHYDIIVADDIVGKENSSTKEQVLKTINFYTQSLQLLKKPHGRYHVRGTRWHESDLYGHLIDNLSNQFDMFIRSIWANEVWDKDQAKWVDDHKGQRYIFPGMFNKKVVEEIKQEVVSDPLQGMPTWMAQYENKIVSSTNAVFKMDAINEYDCWYNKEALEGKQLAFTLYCDPAVSEKQSADYTAFSVRAVDKNDMWYWVELIRKRGMREDDIVEKYIELLKKYPIDLCSMETISFQRNIKYALEKECQKREVFLPFYKIDSSYNQLKKELKIRGLSARYNTGGMKFLKNADDNTMDALRELWSFPKSKHDDLSDSMSGHNQLPVFPSRLYEPNKKEEIKKELQVDRYGHKINKKSLKETPLYI